jgi:predicted O-linked N-acetylglucosamine transferase (SPINDLY family)
MVRYVSGQTRNFLGDMTAAIPQMERAIRLSPVDPLLHQFRTGLTLALSKEGRHVEAVATAERAVVGQPNFVPARRALVVAHVLTGRLEDALQAMRAGATHAGFSNGGLYWSASSGRSGAHGFGLSYCRYAGMAGVTTRGEVDPQPSDRSSR